MNEKRRLLLTAMAGAVGAAGLSVLPVVHAKTADWPARPVKMILPYSAGGPTDVAAREISLRLGQRLGQPVIVENKVGAGGNIASEFVARATADGYTALYHSSGITIAPALYKKLSYDPTKDLTAVAMPASIPIVILVGPAVPESVTSIQEFVQYLKDNPGKVSYGSGGVGNITHLAVELLLQQTGTTAMHVPYKGTAPAMVDLMGGHTNFMMDALSSALPAIRDKRVRAIAVTSSKRAAVLPDLPTVGETVVPDFQASTWHGIFVPAGTPDEIVKRVNDEVNQIVGEPEIKEMFGKQAIELHVSHPDEFAAFVRSEMTRWEGIARASGVEKM